MPDDFQYVKLPDGSYGKFAANASDDVIKSAISKDFPSAFAQAESPDVANRPGKVAPVPVPGGLRFGVQDAIANAERFTPGAAALGASIAPVAGAIEAPLATAVALGTGYLGSRAGGAIGGYGGGMVGNVLGDRKEGSDVGRTIGEWGGGLLGGGLGVAGMESDLGRGLLRGGLSKISSPAAATRIFPFSASEQVAMTPSQGETIAKIKPWGSPPVSGEPEPVPYRPSMASQLSRGTGKAYNPLSELPTGVAPRGGSGTLGRIGGPSVPELPDVLVVPEPNPAIPGIPEGSLYSTPREKLPGLMESQTPGATVPYRAAGGKIIFRPKPTLGTK